MKQSGFLEGSTSTQICSDHFIVWCPYNAVNEALDWAVTHATKILTRSAPNWLWACSVLPKVHKSRSCIVHFFCNSAAKFRPQCAASWKSIQPGYCADCSIEAFLKCKEGPLSIGLIFCSCLVFIFRRVQFLYLFSELPLRWVRLFVW